MSSIDDTDRELIALLRENARVSVAALAKKLHLARGTIQNRLARLERDGIILGYTVKLHQVEQAHRIRAVMMLLIDGNHNAAVIQALRGFPNVTAIYKTNGRWDLIAELHADTLESFDKTLGLIRLVPGVAQSETSLMLSIHKT